MPNLASLLFLLWQLFEITPARLAPPPTPVEIFQRTAIAAPYTTAIAQASTTWQLDPFVLAALLQVESGWQAWRENPRTGAAGIAQFMPSGRQAVMTIRRLRGAPRPFTQAHALDPHQAIPAAAELLVYLQDRCGTLDRALGAYNSGRCGGVRGFRARVWQWTNRLRTQAGLPPLPVAAPPRRPGRRPAV